MKRTIKTIRVSKKDGTKPTPADDLKAMRIADKLDKMLILPDGRIYRPNQNNKDS